MDRAIITVSFLIIFSTLLHADERRLVTFHGAGIKSCGSFLAVAPESNEYEAIEREGKVYIPESVMKSYEFSEWLSGYFSAFNMFNSRKKNIQIPDKISMLRWVKNWCEEHPMKKVADAAQALIVDQTGTVKE